MQTTLFGTIVRKADGCSYTNPKDSTVDLDFNCLRCLKKPKALGIVVIPKGLSQKKSRTLSAEIQAEI